MATNKGQKDEKPLYNQIERSSLTALNKLIGDKGLKRVVLLSNFIKACVRSITFFNAMYFHHNEVVKLVEENANNDGSFSKQSDSKPDDTD